MKTNWINVKNIVPENDNKMLESGYLVGFYIGDKFCFAVTTFVFGKFRDGNFNTTLDGKVHEIVVWSKVTPP